MMTEQEFQEKYLELARKVETFEDLQNFLDKIAEYPHDYGTVVRGLFVSMVAVFNLMDKRCGGITGFQGGCLAHFLLQEFSSIKPPYRIINYNNMLFPQYERDFQKTISMETWKALRDLARVHLSKPRSGETGGKRPLVEDF